jgi:hypothetical protein
MPHTDEPDYERTRQMESYPSYEKALARVRVIQRDIGATPGIIGPGPDGRYKLTYDPDDRLERFGGH